MRNFIFYVPIEVSFDINKMRIKRVIIEFSFLRKYVKKTLLRDIDAENNPLSNPSGAGILCIGMGA